MRAAVFWATVATLFACSREAPPVRQAVGTTLAVWRVTSTGSRVASGSVAIKAHATTLWNECASATTALALEPIVREPNQAARPSLRASCAQRHRMRLEAMADSSGVIATLFDGARIVGQVRGELALIVADTAPAGRAKPGSGDGDGQGQGESEGEAGGEGGGGAEWDVIINGVRAKVDSATIDRIPRGPHPRLGVPLAALLATLTPDPISRLTVRTADGGSWVVEPELLSMPSREHNSRWIAIGRNRRGQPRLTVADAGEEHRVRGVVALHVDTRRRGSAPR